MLFKTRRFDNAAPVLTISNLRVALAGNATAAPVIDDISLTIRGGETVCLVGESGSGKSVTSLAVMGLLPKDALTVTGGVIDLEGQNLLDLDQRAMREIGRAHV